jgi:predicted helicase
VDVRVILDQYKAESLTKFHQDHEFERLMRAFFQTDPYYRNLFSDVWLWQDWPGRAGRTDSGIDLVAQQADSADVWAIQCKFYSENHPVPKGDLDSFFTESGKYPFTERLIVATAPLSHHAEEAFVNQRIAVHTLTLDDLNESPIDWSQFSWNRPQQLTLRSPKTPRPYQNRAITDVLEGFRGSDRGKLIMACGTGKTFTALQIAEEMVPHQGLVLVLMPSLELFSQTLFSPN